MIFFRISVYKHLDWIHSFFPKTVLIIVHFILHFSFKFIADKVTENLANIIKKVSPGNVAPVAGVRKAMGIAPVPPQQISSNSYTTHYVSKNLIFYSPELLPTIFIFLFSIFFSLFASYLLICSDFETMKPD